MPFLGRPRGGGHARPGRPQPGSPGAGSPAALGAALGVLLPLEGGPWRQRGSTFSLGSRRPAATEPGRALGPRVWAVNSGFSADSDPRVVMEPGRVGGWGRGREGGRFTWGTGPRTPWPRIRRPEPPKARRPSLAAGAGGPSAQPFACPAGQSPLPAAVLRAGAGQHLPDQEGQLSRPCLWSELRWPIGPLLHRRTNAGSPQRCSRCGTRSELWVPGAGPTVSYSFFFFLRFYLTTSKQRGGWRWGGSRLPS